MTLAAQKSEAESETNINQALCLSVSVDELLQSQTAVVRHIPSVMYFMNLCSTFTVHTNQRRFHCERRKEKTSRFETTKRRLAQQLIMKSDAKELKNVW